MWLPSNSGGMLSPIVGTWHANGFYGNVRSKCRSDYTQEYRKAAQPQPPEIFLKRMKETPSKHIFSKHDNRHAFPGSATYFENGLGRKRIEGSLPNTRNLIDWIPLKEELQRERPLITSYQADFHSREKVPQLLVHHASLQAQPLLRTPSTTYQHTFRSYSLREPYFRVLKQQAKETESKEQEKTAPASNETIASASGKTTVPVSDESIAAPTSGEPTVPASSEHTATEASTAPVAEALAPEERPLYGRPMSSKLPRWTVSDCLQWHTC
ncbi:hypothetical protein JD844_013248 [Phrynosoma platyrhinos]|uniref:Domain of unknown function with conserved HDNR motif domain-containing protein n=1 Tax=Phrynosoma platyrhinos TaxID=52577 RepID=A0ABQ7TLT3_PHRPL|nr:hypothetical protein JD844_013248 [Phrynosoma platyrhinos]